MAMNYNAELGANNTELQDILKTINTLPNASEGAGENGATFYPSVGENGDLSWSNDKGLENPAPVNIKGPKGDRGESGADGHTPVKGTDYFTSADKTELVNSVRSSLSLGIASDGLIYLFVDGVPIGTGIPQGTVSDVFGYVDENNTVVLKGDLSDGTYSLKYEMENGDIVDIGNMVLDSTVYYTVTTDLTNCANSNSATVIEEGSAYSATITANDGYEISSVTVTMGGSAVSVTDGVISIERVTGDIVITATATEIQTEPVEPTNFAVPNATNKTDWSIWCNDARFGSDGAYRELLNKNNVVTNYVAMEVGDIIRFEGLNVPTTGTSMNNGMHFSDANKVMLSASYLEFYTNRDYLDATVTDGVYEIDTAKLVNHTNAGASKYFRISGILTGTLDDVIINVKRNGQWL